MAENVRGLSLKIDPATANLWAAFIGGGLALAGVVLERLMHLAGFLRFFNASRWDTTYFGGEDDYSYGIVDDPKDATEVRYPSPSTCSMAGRYPPACEMCEWR